MCPSLPQACVRSINDSGKLPARRTALPVRRLGYGTAQLTGPGYWGPRGEARDAVAVPRRAVERGVTLIDTADNYGPSIAEELVAARSGTSGSTR
ncbi:aldo/keto reductase [Streptomyces sp. NPDC050597]|uniref:aldo/keto reductase n=1 Tax=Streptomyces sp. NPDC050597 TaxID=3157212 RepID=UPI00342D47BA